MMSTEICFGLIGPAMLPHSKNSSLHTLPTLSPSLSLVSTFDCAVFQRFAISCCFNRLKACRIQVLRADIVDKRFIMISLLLGVAGNAAYAVLLRVADVPRPTEILLTVVLLLILPFSLLHSRQFGKHGFANIWDSKLEKFNLLNQIQSSKKSLFFLGVSARTIMQPQIEYAI